MLQAKEVVQSSTMPVSYPLSALIREGRMMVMPAFARKILNDCYYERQRRIYTHHVRLLAGEMLRGSFGQGSQLAFCSLNGRLILVNGYHRMKAVIEANVGQEFQILIQDVESQDDVDREYHHYDVSARARSVQEVLNSVSFSKKSGLTKMMAKTLYEVALLLENNFNRINYQLQPQIRSVDYRIELANKWIPHAVAFEKAIKLAPVDIRAKLMNIGPASVGLATFAYQPVLAEKFWSGLAARDGLRRDDPRMTLFDDLLRRKMSQDSRNQGEKSCALAWNAFVENRRLKLIKVYPDSKMKILGTPWR